MNKYKNILLLTTALGAISSSLAQAGKLTVINNHPTERVQLCIRGEEIAEKNQDNTFRYIVNANSQEEFTITKENVRGQNTFEVIASTGSGGDPDWKLMGGKCSHLVTDADHTLLIDSTAGKLSCKNVTAKNPPSN